MTAHRHRNKLTALIYSLTLGSIIFLLVAATLQIQIIIVRDLGTADIKVVGKSAVETSSFDSLVFSSQVDPFLIEYKDKIRDFGVTTHRMSES